MDMDEIKKMNAAERLQAMEALWDSMLQENTKIDTPQWHDGILAERRRMIESGRAKFVSLSELKASRYR